MKPSLITRHKRVVNCIKSAIERDTNTITRIKSEKSENAEERTPKEAILVRRVIITKQGAKHYDRDFCRFTCQCKYNLENYGGVAA